MKKRVIMIILFVLVVFLTFFILDDKYKIDLTPKIAKKDDPNLIKNTNENVTKDAKLKGLDLTNISLSYMKGTGSTFAVTLINNTDSPVSLESFNITFKDSNGNVIAVLSAYVGGNVDPKQQNSIKVTAKEDISGAASVEYSEN